MTKKIIVTFSDGASFVIPAEFVANARAKYYADKEIDYENSKFSEIFNFEVEFAMKNDDELIDWVENQMNWEDVKEIAVYIENSKREIDKEDEWTNAEKEIISE